MIWPLDIHASNRDLSIENVRVDRPALRPGEVVNISFYLTRAAKVTLSIFDSNYQVVRKLMDGGERPAGINGVTWDGRDDSGEMVPDEAYVLSIVAEGADGKKSIYDPTSISGGETLYPPIRRIIEESSGMVNIHYSVPNPSRVSIKSGIRNGPLLKTILDWKPLPAGDYVQTWDGMDETGQIKAMKEPKSILFTEGFRLPENSIIVQGGKEDYPAHHRRFKPFSQDRMGHLTFQKVRENALKRVKQGISPQYLVPQTLNRRPQFIVSLDKERAIGLAKRRGTRVSGQVGLTIEVSPESLSSFNELRYEIVVFVDNQRFDEEEQAYSTYTYWLDTTQLTNGEHLITINLSSMTGQIGSYSFKIDVKN